jgi:hypothetical protein
MNVSVASMARLCIALPPSPSSPSSPSPPPLFEEKEEGEAEAATLADDVGSTMYRVYKWQVLLVQPWRQFWCRGSKTRGVRVREGAEGCRRMLDRFEWERKGMEIVSRTSSMIEVLGRKLYLHQGSHSAYILRGDHQ